MHTAAQHLVGTHDFSSFRAAECQSPTATRLLYRIDVTRHYEYVVIDVTANAFLHHMVRNIAGVLIAIGRGDQGIDWSIITAATVSSMVISPFEKTYSWSRSCANSFAT